MPWLETTVEVVKNVGSVGGLASSIFLVYDRFMRGKPQTSLRPHDHHAELFVVNTANEPIIIDEVEVTPPVVTLAKADDTRSTLEAVAARMYPALSEPEKIFVIIGPEEKRGFPIVELTAFKEAPDSLAVTIQCVWRKTNKPLPIKQRTKLKTTVGDLRAIREVALKQPKPKPNR